MHPTIDINQQTNLSCTKFSALCLLLVVLADELLEVEHFARLFRWVHVDENFHVVVASCKSLISEKFSRVVRFLQSVIIGGQLGGVFTQVPSERLMWLRSDENSFRYVAAGTTRKYLKKQIGIYQMTDLRVNH